MGREQPAKTATSFLPARSHMSRAFPRVFARGTFPATVVMPRTWISSVEASARRMATASSWPGSQSRIIGLCMSVQKSTRSLEKDVAAGAESADLLSRPARPFDDQAVRFGEASDGLTRGEISARSPDLAKPLSAFGLGPDFRADPLPGRRPADERQTHDRRALVDEHHRLGVQDAHHEIRIGIAVEIPESRTPSGSRVGQKLPPPPPKRAPPVLPHDRHR